MPPINYLKEYKKQDPEGIKALFGSIAPQYDKTNAAMSLFLHKFWNSQLIKLCFADKSPGPYLDLCCGTGAIALAYLSKQKQAREVSLVDFCPQMLKTAKDRSLKAKFPVSHTLDFIEADAQALPFDNAQFDFITMAYGIRNIESPLKALEETYRVLKPAGRLAILELTRPQNPVFKKAHQLYLLHVLPIIGKLFTSNQQAYEYLSQSIHQFISPQAIKHLLLEIGFKKTKSIPLTFGVANIILAEK